mgnify:CR=1 FL=1
MDKIVQDALEEAEDDVAERQPETEEDATTPDVTEMAGAGGAADTADPADASADGATETDEAQQDLVSDETDMSRTRIPRSPDGSNSQDGRSGGDADGGRTSDQDLEAVLEELETNITVVGCGGGGCNTVNRMVMEGIEGADLVATNTDVQHLVDITADDKLLIGEQKTGGRGAGSVPKVGEEAALESKEAIRDSIGDSDMVFVTAGLGGGTGTGSAPVVAQTAQDQGALTIAIVTTPFDAEGEVRRTNAEAGLERLREVADTVIVVPNDRLIESVGKLPVDKAFRVADEVLMRSVKGITELITKPGLVNLDFADVRTVMERGGVAMIGLGEAEGDDKAEHSVTKALRSPLLDVNIASASSALVNVTGGSDMTIDEAEGVVEEIHDRIETDARIIWGTSVDEDLEGEMRTMIVVTGVESPQIYGKVPEQEPQSPEGIDYVD